MKENKDKFAWIPFYEAFSKALLSYKDDRKTLLKKIVKVNGDSEYIQKSAKIGDIDPFTIMANINRIENSSERYKTFDSYAKELGIKNTLPSDIKFWGIPYFKERDQEKSPRTIYYGTESEKDNYKNNIKLLWNLFENAVNYKKNDKNMQQIITEQLKDANKIGGNGLSTLTAALYWTSPKKFLSLDETNTNFIKAHQDIFESKVIQKIFRNSSKQSKKDTDTIFDNYFDIIKEISDICKTNDSFSSFPELSDVAFQYDEDNKEKKRKEKKNSEENKTKQNLEGAGTLSNVGKNIIVYGVPGSGKSYYIEKQLRKQLKSEKDYRECVERVIFYPEYSYYDFVGQKVPNEKGGLDFAPGNFTNILKEALKNQAEVEENKNKQKHYYLVIEELNRGNAEAIFGDVFQLLDRNSSGESTYSIDNNSLKEYFKKEINTLEENEIKIPANLTIYATINNADQNVFNFDTAFGRRWEYQMMPCDPKNENEDNTKGQLFKNGFIKGTNIKWNELRTKINYCILENKNEIYNAEEKRLGLYYINSEWLTLNNNEKNEEVVKAFAAKLFRYLYLNVFKNNIELMFQDIGHNILEEYIENFVKNKNISSILKIEAASEESNNNEED